MKLLLLLGGLIGFLSCTTNNKHSMDPNSSKKISESEFQANTQHLPHIERYLQKEGVLVVPINSEEIYVNLQGDCYVVGSIHMVDSLIEQMNSLPLHEEEINLINNVSTTGINSTEIVNGLLKNFNIQASEINDRTIKAVERAIVGSDDRLAHFEPLYFLIGEYFRWGFKHDVIIWQIEIDPRYGVKIPILFYKETGKKIFFAEYLFSYLHDPKMDVPLAQTIELIFYYINH